MTSWQRSRASPDPIAATAPTAFAGPAPFRKWLPSTTEPRRLGVATDAEKSWPGVLVLAELKIEKGNLVECAAKGLGEARDLESDACGRRAERLDKHRVVLLAGLAKATKRFEAQPLVDRSGGGLMMHLIRTPPLAPCDYFSCEDSEISAAVLRSRRPPMRSRGFPTARASCRWTQPRCPASRSRADALRATTSQFFSEVEHGASRKLTLKVAVEFFASF